MSSLPIIIAGAPLRGLSAFAVSRIVARDEQNRLPLGLDAKTARHFAFGGGETHLFHIGVLRP